MHRIHPLATTEHRRRTMIEHLGIDTVSDVGANLGQYALHLRGSGYKQLIVSFEPLTEAFAVLKTNAHSDPYWRVLNVAIGAEDGEADINISATSASSSLLPMLETHVRYAPGSKYVSMEHVRVKTLDTVAPELLSRSKRVLLKIDTQGYEHQVLKGAASLLQQVHLIECELSLVPLYDGQYLFLDMVSLLDRYGFKPVHFEPGFGDPATGYCLQVDGMFARTEAPL
jgi:FkbM family methyltransferase